MESNPLVSVIIPAYNTEKYIRETIDSVLTQTYPNIELILVDDGSTDNTASITETLIRDKKNTRLVRQKNQGVSAARNNGFAVSNGSYIAYLDADDVWTPRNVERWLLKFAADSELVVVHSDCQEIDGESKKINIIHHGHEGFLLDNLLQGGKWINGTSGSLVKREIIQAVGGFDVHLSTGADQEFFFRIASKGKVGRVPEVLWYYRIHSNNMHYNTKLLEKDTLLAFIRADEHKLFRTPAFRRLCLSKMNYMLAGSFWNTDKLKSMKYLVKSVAWHPLILRTFLQKLFR